MLQLFALSRRLPPSRSLGRLGATFTAISLVACCGSRTVLHDGLSHFTWRNSAAEIYTVQAEVSNIAIYGLNTDIKRPYSFATLKQALDIAGDRLMFATNGGMYQPDYSPVGLLVQDGIERSPLNLNKGTGNFFLKPNGVFLLHRDGKAAIVESERYTSSGSDITFATQSGPLLVSDGKLNTLFRKDSSNKLVRSGVGICKAGKVVFAISDGPITFWDFAVLFKEGLHCKNALYLDGVISRFYNPASSEVLSDQQFGTLIAVKERHDK